MDIFAACDLAYKALQDYGLLAKDWAFAWSNAKTMCGQCFHAYRTIRLSKPYVEANAEADVRNTVLHEIAHALVGPSHGHDQVWKLKALEVGARPETDARAHVIMPAGKFAGVCPGCNKTFYRHRRPNPGPYNHVSCRQRGRPSEIEWRKTS